ncbi:argininosuccinate synthase domain-containing protein [Campylobacter geochelonis]|uniref:Thiamine biosynthesis protein:ExsB n=1 Tax=Campylobacter geochelonis TaxID=1780362 RepID=A0A128ECX0_9BACT|nr:argininosuccinate synthase domain-containing protein [Campylobacter geochelonis]QKF70378.1 tRNA U34 2-thiouridine synthase, MnmA family [Campylobacter geochelonis]CZE46222.1 thiamine biosynthesis protein:ExsB [Campylobacter geochelonis]CZE46408.1 thiamine biosynthesis protein:ExsB [Campylobacter geochelonis]CZE50736.1 thiamine biosynthesis protein:ExsB [Campylobacter geochelonis]
MKALSLFSGGLDSMLAIRLMAMQGIEVTALHMDIGFGSRGDKSELLRKRAELAGAKFKIIDIKNKYLQDVLLHPKYGYGKNFNPCVDCHGFMFKTALLMLEDEGASFIVTGEVLGQRPMSQRKEALFNVSSLSGDENGLILRPLCAKHLEPTTPELKGWVEREKLLDISGRGRTRQLAMAKEFGFDEFESPGGGCLLTMQNFASKMKDALKFEGLDTYLDTQILKFGRHLRLDDGAKVIIGRDEKDNEGLERVQNPKFSHIALPDDMVGAYSLISKNASKNDKLKACKFALTYAKTSPNLEYEVAIDGEKFIASPFESKSQAQKYLVGLG